MNFNRQRHKRQREQQHNGVSIRHKLHRIAPPSAAPAINRFLDLPQELLALALDFAGGLRAEATCKAWHAAPADRSALLIWILGRGKSGGASAAAQLLQTAACKLRRRNAACLRSLSVHGPGLSDSCEFWRGALLYGLLHRNGIAALPQIQRHNIEGWLDRCGCLDAGAGAVRLQLLHLDLSGCPLAKNGTTSCWIVRAICEQNTLQRLALNDCGLGDDALPMLSCMTELRELELGANRRLRLMPPEATEGSSSSTLPQRQYRIHPLSKLQHLRRLRLGALIASVAPSKLPSGSRRQPAGSGAVSSCGCEKRMRLHRAAFDTGLETDHDIIHPSVVLPLTLTELDLAWSGRSLGRASFAALSPLTALKSLRLNGCKQFDDACACAALRGMHRLTALNLSGTSVGRGYYKQRGDEQLPRARGTDGAEMGDTIGAWLCATRLPELRTLLLADVRHINGYNTDSAITTVAAYSDGLMQVHWEAFNQELVR